MGTLDAEREAVIREIAYAARSKSLVAFVGSGLSTGLPGWDELISFMYSALGLVKDEAVPDNPADVAEWYAAEVGDTQRIDRELKKLSIVPTSGEIVVHRMLVRLGVRVFWTTNFDPYIETAIEREIGEEPLIVTSYKDLVRLQVGRPTVFKLHGSVGEDVAKASKVILSREDFEASFLERRLLLDYLVYYLQTHNFLFLGLSFRDPDLDYVRLVLRSMYGRVATPRTHFFVMREPPRSKSEDEGHFRQRQLRFAYWTRQMARYGFRHIPLSDYSEVPLIARRLLETICTPLPYAVTVRAFLPDPTPGHRQVAYALEQSRSTEHRDELVRFDLAISLATSEPIDYLVLVGLKWKWRESEWAQPTSPRSVQATHSAGRSYFVCPIGRILYEATVTGTVRNQHWSHRYELQAQTGDEAGVIGKAVALGKIDKHLFHNACTEWQERRSSAYIHPDHGQVWFPVPDPAEGPLERIVLKPAHDDEGDAKKLWLELLGNPELELSFQVTARYADQTIRIVLCWSAQHDGFEVLASDPHIARTYWLEYPATRDTPRPFLPRD